VPIASARSLGLSHKAMANPDEKRERESESSSGDIGQRVNSLWKKASKLDETLTEIEEHLDEAQREQKD
jgi:hypothetical protein